MWRTTVMVRVRQRYFDRVVWPEYGRLQSELESYLEGTTDFLFEHVMGSDGDDCALDRG